MHKQAIRIRSAFYSQAIRWIQQSSVSTSKPAQRQSINLKQAAYLQQFEGLPLSMIARQSEQEPKYTAE